MSVSIREYARMRGCSHTAVMKAIKSGRILKGEDGKIDPDKANADWEKHTSPISTVNAQSMVNANKTRVATKQSVKDPAVSPKEAVAVDDPVRTVPQIPRSTTASQPTPPQVDSTQGIPPYQTSRAIREAYAARIARLDYEQRVKGSLKTEDVERDAIEMYRRTRDRLQGIPRRNAALLAAEKDPKAVELLLDQEIRTALEEIAK